MIKRLNIPKYTKQWYDFRKSGYGASENATVLAEYNDQLLNELPGGSPIQVHLTKIGEQVTNFTGNLKSKAGQSMENVILNFYRYWDHLNPSAEIMYDNYANKKKKNRVKSASFIFKNDAYDWLYSSPDGVELEQDDNGDWKEVGLIEVKNTTSYQANKYPHGVSPTFITQVAQGLLLSEFRYARILVFVDGYDLRVVTLDAQNETIKAVQKDLIYNTAQSWLRVLKAKKIKKESGIDQYRAVNVDELSLEKLEAITKLQDLEPDLTGTKHEFDWVSENIVQTPEFSTMELTDDQWKMMVKRDALKKREKTYSDALKKRLNVVESEMKLSLGSFHQADYEGDKAFSYKPDKRGIKKLYVNPELLKIRS